MTHASQAALRNLASRSALRPLAQALAACSMLTLWPFAPNAQAQALPGGLHVASGQAQVGINGQTMTVTNSANAILNWQSFNIGASNIVRFQQPSAASQVLNRVTGKDPSAILGQLNSNGKVWLINPNGVLFGRNARVDVAGLVASTLDVDDSRWRAGQYAFSAATGTPDANVTNLGELHSSLGGRIALLGGDVSNEGLIEAPGGQVLLAAGRSMDLVDTGVPNLTLRVTAPQGEALNLGSLSAPGGRVDIQAAVVNQQGIVRADALDRGPGGAVVLRASSALTLAAGSTTTANGAAGGGSVTLDAGAGTALVSGNVAATATAGTGGTIELLGHHVGALDGAGLDASGALGGGSILMGGGERGQDAAIANAAAAYVAPHASLRADALQRGDGGTIVLWSDDATRAYGSFSARGGPGGGNGGGIETSGGWLDARPASVDASAPAGRAGRWLLDPNDLTIVNGDAKVDANVSDGPDFTTTGDKAVLGTYQIETALNGGQNVTVTTSSHGANTDFGDITMNDASINVWPLTNVSLTISAARNITLNDSSIAVVPAPILTGRPAGDSGSGALNVSLQAANGGIGAITLKNTTITTNGGNLVLGGAGQAAAGADKAPFLGAVGYTAPEDTSHGNGVDVNSSALDAGSGNISINGATATSTIPGVAGVVVYSSTLSGKDITINGWVNGAGPRTGVELFGGTLKATDAINVSGTVHETWNPEIGAAVAGVYVGASNLSVLAKDDSGSQLVLDGAVVMSGTPVASDTHVKAGIVIDETGGQSLRLTGGGLVKIAGSIVGAPSGNSVVISGAEVSDAHDLIDASGARLLSIQGTGPSMSIAAAGIAVPDGGELQIASSGALAIADTSAFRSDEPSFSTWIRGNPAHAYIGAGTDLTLTNSGIDLCCGGDSLTLRAGASGSYGTLTLDNAGVWGGNMPVFLQGNGVVLRNGSLVSSTANGDSIVVSGPNHDNVSSFHDDGESLATYGGRWLVYAADPSAEHFGASALREDFRQYDASPGTAVAGSGNGFLFSLAPTLTFSGNPTKVYDGSTFIGLSSDTLAIGGIVDGDRVYVGEGAFGNFADKNAGIGKAITLDGDALSIRTASGTPIYGYGIGTIAGTVTRKPITFGDVTASSKIYDGNTTAAITPSTPGIRGLVGDETLAVTPTGTFDTKDAGIGKVVTVDFNVANGGGGGLASNYSWSGATTHADVTPRTITLPDVTAANKVYDGNTVASVSFGPGGITGLVGDETLAITPSGTFDSKNAGADKVVTLFYSLADGSNGGRIGNYQLAGAVPLSTRADITPKPITFGDWAAANKVYDGNTAATITPSPVSIAGLVGDETLVVTPTGTFDTKNAATGKLVTVDFSVANGSGGGLASNYSWSSAATTHADITPKPLTFDFSAANKVYDGNTTATITPSPVGIGGLIGDETLLVTPTGTFDTKNAGTGKLVTVDFSVANGSGGGLASNYSWSAGATTHADITPRPVTFGDFTAANKVYDGNTVASVTPVGVGGLVGDETLAVTPTGTFDTKNAGTGKLVTVDFSVADGSGGGLASNYSWSPVATTHADITRKPVTFGDYAAANKVYDGNTTATITPSPVSIAGLVGDETLVVTPTGTFDTKNAGTGKLVTVDFSVANGSGGGLASNYSWLSAATTHADVTPKPITFGDLAAANKIYDGNTAATIAPVSIGGLVGDETLVVTSTGAFDTKNAATGKLVTVDFNVSNGSGGGLASNYAWASAATTHADITPKPVTFGDYTAANKVYDGNTSATITPSPVSVNGLVGDETLVVTPTGTFDTKNAGTGKLVTVDFSVANGSGGGLASNYSWLPVATTHADVTRKPITFGDYAAANKVYDGNTVASVTPVGIGGLVGDETLVVTPTGTFDTKNAATGKLVTVHFNVADGSGGGLASNYSWTASATTHADVTPRPITFGDLAASNKVYDGNTAATIAPVSIGGLVGDESLVVTPTGTFDTKNAATGKLVTVDFSVANGSGGGLASNYSWSASGTTHADVTPKAITFGDVTAANKVYDGSAAATVAPVSVSGLVGDETLVVTPTGTFDTKNAASGKLVTVDFSVANGADGGLASNYSWLHVATTHADVTAKPITFGDLAAANKVYDGSTSATIAPVSIGGLVGGETLVVTSTGTFDTKNAATGKLVNVDFSVANGGGGGLASNYSWSASATTHADVTPKAITFGDLAAANKVYDGSAVATIAPVSIGGLVGDETLAVTASGTFDTKNAATGKLVTVDFSVANGADGGLASNYAWSHVATTRADVTPKPITFGDVAAANKVYDGSAAASVAPVSVSGLVGGETLVVTPSGTFDTKNAGTSKLVTVDFSVANGGDGGLASNYSWSHVATTRADVNAKPITFGDVAASNKIYDGSAAATVGPVSVGGLVGDETLVVTPTGTFDTKNAATGKLVSVDFSVANGGNGGLASNYSWSAATTTRADITPKPIAIGALAAADKTYDGTRNATVVDLALDGLVGSETLGIASSGRFDTKDAGNGKTVTVDVALSNGSHGGLASNYAIVSTTGTTTASIQPKAISVDALTAANKTYDGTTSATVTGWSLLGVVAGDQVLVAAGSGAFTSPGAGTGKTVVGTATALGGVDAGNYVFGSNRGTGSADVAPATLTYAAGTANGIAGAPVVPLTGRLTGFVPGDTQADATTGALTWSTPATSGSGAGTYAVTGSGLNAANYVFVQSPDNAAALTLTPLPPTATSVGSVNTSLASSLQSVQVATVATTASQGRVLDVTAALQVGSTEGDATFGSLPLAEMSRDAVAALLAARDAYKRDLFANAIAQLQKDPGAADLPVCTTAGQVETGECLITAAQRDKARTEYLARADILDALPPTAAGPAAGAMAYATRVDALPGGASTPAPAPDPIAVLDALSSPPPLIEKRQIRNAALPQIQRKVAVVIGVDHFDDKRIPELKNAVSDAKSVATMLESSLGYETIVVENATRKSVIKTLNRLAAEVGPADSVIVYYAGHGELVPATGLGYWQLADADADKPETWLSNVDIGKLLAQFGASQVALVSDSCYSGSLVTEQIRATADKLDPSKVLAGRAVVVMSSGGNEPVFDSGKDGHSTFASSLMQRLQQVSAWQAGGNVFERVRFDVARQLPQHPQYGASVAAGHQDGTDYLFEQRQLDAAK